MRWLLLNAKPRVAVSLTLEQGAVTAVDLNPSQKGFEVFFTEEPPEELTIWLEAYASGKPLRKLPLLAERGFPGFTEHIHASLQEIPFGKTVTYEELAVKTGHPRAARAVGSACGRNPFPLFIPCHRVIRAADREKPLEARLGGFFFDLSVKKELLLFEASFFNN